MSDEPAGGRLARERVLFVSDVHLTPALPDVFLRFCRFLTDEAAGARALYILGDLFDFWIGRRQVRQAPYAEVLRRIRELSEAGTDVFFVQGNRDYMLDAGFAAAHGMKLLPDVAEVTVGGKRIVVTHGDLLVTKDVAYLRMRRVLRSRPMRWLLANLPLSLALRISGRVQRATGSAVRAKPAYVLEPDWGLARRWLSDGVHALVFGHVHRGEHVRLFVDGRRADVFIPGAWEDRPGWVEWDGEKLALRSASAGRGRRDVTGRRVIAIDGPSGSGKSTVARRLAERTGFRFLDSGAMYRAAALLASRKGIEDAEPARLGDVLRNAAIELSGDRVLLDGEDVSDEIRTPEITRYVSVVAAVPEVRAAMVERQRRVFPGEDLVVEGRDIGSVVFPDADLKFYVTAGAKERARRRALQTDRDAADVLREQEERDARDMGREHSPLILAEGAVVIETDGLSIDEVVDRIASRIGEEAS
ncbi:MAG: (d)CMP kinase [Planctomycetota bacterium]